MADAILIGLSQEEDRNGIVSQNEECEFIGIEYVCAYAKQRGLDVRVEHNSKSPKEIVSENPFLVGLSVMASNYECSREFSKGLKKIGKNVKVVWGGPHATNYYEDVLREGSVDYVVIGEGERTFFNLADNLIHSRDNQNLEGIVFFNGRDIVKTPKQERLTPEELDAIDARLIHSSEDDAVFFAKQIPHSVLHSDMRFAIMVGSRGCWNDCSFCSSNSMWGRRIVYRSPGNVVNELDFLVREKGANFVFFSDDDFLINEDWCKSIAKEIIRKNIEIKYHVMGSVHSASKFSNYELLKKSGCCEITLGMETTNQRILDSIGKKYKISMLPPVANEITGHGIHLGLYYMLGYPEQTSEDLTHDLEFIKTIPFSRIRAVFLTPYPGTKLYEDIEKKNLWLDGYRNNWPMFTNDKPVIRTKATPEELVEARKDVLRLYFSEEYEERMHAMRNGDIKSKQAFEEFQSFLRAVI